MGELETRRGTAPTARQTLFLVFCIGHERYALQAIDVVEVLPRLPLADRPGAVLGGGVFAWRGTVVPVIDLCALTFGHSAKARTSTRLVLVRYQGDTQQTGQVLGLILNRRPTPCAVTRPISNPMGWTTGRRRTSARCAKMPRGYCNGCGSMTCSMNPFGRCCFLRRR